MLTTTTDRPRIPIGKGKIITTQTPKSFLALGGTFHVKKPIKAECLRDHIDFSTQLPSNATLVTYDKEFDKLTDIDSATPKNLA